ncbi:DedA family protein [Streptomyces sp. NPDC093589]|uniref:DedA family protein n=1 Tax=Streptomyces sp. NPDC093589 TaxID=3366043 RepID=UPI0037F222E0
MDFLTLALPQEPAGGIAGWAADLVDAMGAPGAGLVIALENLFPALPSEVILPLTGFAAGQGVISLASALFAGRMVPIFRSLISVPAGVERMPLPTFLALTTLGSLIWNSVLVMVRYWLGDQWELVEAYFGFLSQAVLVLVVVVFAVYVLVRVRNRNQPQAQHRRSS